jgi:energy-converting hydrogenase Eha subunit A
MPDAELPQRAPSPAARGSFSARLRAAPRGIFLLIAALGSIAAIGFAENRHYPIRQWLLFRVLGYFLLSLYWGVGCLAVGLDILERAVPRQYRKWEAPFVAFPLGVLTFGISVFVVGLFGRLGTAFFLLSPLVFVLVGYSSLVRLADYLRAEFRRSTWRPTGIEIVALLFGAVGLVFVYLPILTPHNVQHDARWYHLTIAEQYAAQGAVTRFPEGWFLGAYPQLASLLYTWAMLMPVGIVHRIELCAHLEFIVFLMTIAAMPALVRRILPGTLLPLAWAAFFLFPGFLVYDSNLSVGADHIAALFAPAGMLALYPALRTLGFRHAALVGALAGGAALTKYSAVSVAVPLVGALLARAGWLAQKGRHVRRALTSAAAVICAFAVVWSPHWLKNLAWYGDPAYPILHHWFQPHPWTSQAESYFRIFIQLAILSPTHDLAGALESLRVALTLGLGTQAYGFHDDFPTFGFLFAATLYCLPFSSSKWRVWLAYGIAESAALVWYWTNHRDRYLQACLPWLVAATLSMLHSMWKRWGAAGRAAALLLVGAQVVSGAGLALLPVSFMIPGDHALSQVTSLIGAGYKKEYGSRFEPFEEWGFSSWTALGKRVPRGSRVLVHEDRLWLGLDAPVVVDEAAWQGGICYSDFANAAEVWGALQKLGVTHVVTGVAHPDGGGHGLAGDIVFWDFLFSHAARLEKRGALTLWKMPAERPPVVPLGPSLILTCNQSQPLGLYENAQILRREPAVAVAVATVPDEVLRRAEFVILEADCEYPDFESRLGAFRRMTERGKVSFWKRTP